MNVSVSQSYRDTLAAPPPFPHLLVVVRHVGVQDEERRGPQQWQARGLLDERQQGLEGAHPVQDSQWLGGWVQHLLEERALDRQVFEARPPQGLGCGFEKGLWCKERQKARREINNDGEQKRRSDEKKKLVRDYNAQSVYQQKYTKRVRESPVKEHTD